MTATRLWLLLLCAGIGGSGWLLTRAPAPPAAPSADPVLLLPAPGLEALNALEIVGGAAPVQIERVGGHWRYQDRPVTAAAAPFIRERVAMLAVARIERRFDVAPAATAAYGIDPGAPALRLKLGAHQVEFRIGGRTPDGFGQYLWQAAHAEMLTVPAYHIDNLVHLAIGPGTPAPGAQSFRQHSPGQR